ncbi:ABC transporter substrate-binding protein [Candidatus Enterococcus lemimoniae]|uniref:Extracellular solute-binding protein n=1 Tax=Candidatus Enterococcus lemimoniae TaxID=1834167 RepID=A0ABZ2TAF3_9ENTE|nr:ABC transporter substrate-binding protein [Enterococcus sp. 12C11_DIV0727]OTO67957.1 extracellular solute-binding protein [Enterococcus sp. 12C11_DIV0727]
MKTWKKVVGLSTAVVLLVALTACGGGSKKKTAGSSKKADEGTLLMYQIGDKPENYDALMEVANKRIEEKTGAKLNIQYIGWGDYKKKMSVIVSSGENYDIAFADSYVPNAQKGAFADLTELAPKFAKDAYEQLDEAYIKGNLVDGKLYAFPVNGNVYSQQVLTFNKQYLDKYNLSIDDIKTYKDAESVLKTFHEKEPNIAAFAIGQGFKAQGDFDFPIGNDYPFAVDLNGDTKKIINQYENKDFMDVLKTMHKWYQAGYIPSDAATSNTEFPLEGNTWFIRQETQGPYDYGDTILSNAAGQELVSTAFTKALKSSDQARMANFVVSNTSKNKEKAVEVLGQINSDPELLNGLVWGIEGEAWEKIPDKDGKIKLLDGYKPNMHLPAWNTGNNKILYTQDTITEDMIKERDESIAKAETSPILGFNFVTSNVKTEMSNIANVMSQYLDGLNTGTVDPEETVPKLKEALDNAGYDKVLTEMQKQYDEFLKK